MLIAVFYCQLCSTCAAAGEKAIRLVVSKKVVKFPFRSRANLVRRPNELGQSKKRFIDDPGGQGEQIEKELLVCSRCAREHS